MSSAIESMRELIENSINHDFVLTTYPCQHGVSCTAETLLAHLDNIARDYVELPKDADGVPIKPGDVLQVYGDRRVCYKMALGPMDYWEVSTDQFSSYLPDEYCELHHCHATTVEDELREMMREIREMGDFYVEDVLLAKYAPLLRLAGDGDE